MPERRRNPVEVRAMTLPETLASAAAVALMLFHEGRAVQSITVCPGQLPQIVIAPTPRLCDMAEHGQGATWVAWGRRSGECWRTGQLDHPEAVIRFKQVLEAVK